VLLTVDEATEHKMLILTLLDRPVIPSSRGEASAEADPVNTSPAIKSASVAVSPTADSEIVDKFLKCICEADSRLFKELLGAHGLQHSRRRDGATLLHLCASFGFLQGVCLLLQSKCPMRLDLNGCSALHYAAASNQPLIASELLSAFPSSLAMCNDAGDSAFIVAVRAKAPAVLAVLIAVPKAPSSRTAAVAKGLSLCGAEGLPPLHLAVKIGALHCAELILGAQPSQVNLQLPTVPHPLHVAASSPSEFAEGAVKLLLQCGADISAKDGFGLTAAEVAAAAGNLSLARILNNVAVTVADLEALKVSAI
jgi:ankyrin repeat protein